MSCFYTLFVKWHFTVMRVLFLVSSSFTFVLNISIIEAIMVSGSSWSKKCTLLVCQTSNLSVICTKLFAYNLLVLLMVISICSGESTLLWWLSNYLASVLNSHSADQRSILRVINSRLIMQTCRQLERNQVMHIRDTELTFAQARKVVSFSQSQWWNVKDSQEDWPTNCLTKLW